MEACLHFAVALPALTSPASSRGLSVLVVCRDPSCNGKKKHASKSPDTFPRQPAISSPVVLAARATPNLTQLMRVGGLLECDQHFTPDLSQLRRVGDLFEWDQQFTPNLSQLRRVGGLLEWNQHFTPNLSQLRRVGGLLGFSPSLRVL